MGFLSGPVLKNLLANAEDVDLIPWVGKIPCKRKWQPTQYSWLGKSHGQRSLAGCSPQGAKHQAWLSHWTHTWRRKHCGAGLPWGLSGKESTCRCRARGCSPWPATIPQAAEQRSPVRRNHWACCAVEPRRRQHGGHVHSRACGPQGEKPSRWEVRASQL